jgi:hypothetical protein
MSSLRKMRSHRARSTLATQLYNAKQPMTLFELMNQMTYYRNIPLMIADKFRRRNR